MAHFLDVEAPSCRASCERVRVTDVCREVPKPLEVCVRNAHPCKKRKYGAPAVVVASARRGRATRPWTFAETSGTLVWSSLPCDHGFRRPHRPEEYRL